MNTQHFTKKEKGFAMLFTVLVISLILSIALGISNLTFKQTILSNLAKDSQISFYEADAAIECAMYYDISNGAFTSPMDPGVFSTVQCGNDIFTAQQGESTTDYIVFRQDNTAPNLPCASFSIDKRSAPQTIVQARGYNTCGDSPRKVERALDVRY